MPPINDLDQYCRTCGYNLRGLAGDPLRCPECGKPHRRCTKYTLFRHFWRFGTHFSVLDDARRRVFEFESRQLSLGRNFNFRSAYGEKLLRIDQRQLTLMTEFDLYRNGRPIGALRHKALSFRHHEFVLESGDAASPAIECKCAGRRWRLHRAGEFVAETFRPWFGLVTSVQTVDLAGGEDTELILAMVLVIRTVVGRA